MILTIEGLSYRYPGLRTWTLEDLTLTVSKGETVLIAGTSGSGKSTFCRVCTGLIPHFHGGELIGQVVVNGLNTRHHPVHRLFSQAGLVFQNTEAQLFNRTVEAELAYGLESLGLPAAEIRKRTAWAAEVTGVGAIGDRAPQTLSGGEKQRVVLAAILALRPALLLLDEPFTHLDPEGTEALRKILRDLRAEGLSLIVVEHRLHEIVAEADRLVLLHQGRIAADGPWKQVVTDALTAYGLHPPPLIKLFRLLGRSESPLTIEDARDILLDQEAAACRPDRILSKLQRKPPAGNGPSAKTVLEVEDLYFDYEGKPVLRGLDFRLAEGQCVALVGRNGAGKTTLLKQVNGLLKPKRGRVKVLGKDTRFHRVAEMARSVGFAWQNPNDQLFQTSVRKEILTGPKALKAYDSTWLESLFNRFNLNPLLERSPFQLSEGEKKRVSFASALSIRPELLILDEPTAGQDDFFRQELAALIALLREEGRTVLLVTHDLEFAAEQADRWLVLAGGKIIADNSPEKIMADEKIMAAAGLRPTLAFQLLKALDQARGGEKPYARSAL
jgi:energy-coupling factor transport system ATP-binding protein